MKRILAFTGIFIIFIICTFTCTIHNKENKNENPNVTTVTIEGEKHEFIVYRVGTLKNITGLAHYTNCKYCKNK